MDANCAKCGTHLASSGGFCPECGSAVVHEIHPVEHRHHPVRGAFGGLYYGLIAAPILIIPGILLCLLGWGICLGALVERGALYGLADFHIPVGFSEKEKKSGLFAEVRRFRRVIDGGVGKVVKKKGLDAQSCKQRTYGDKKTEIRDLEYRE